jgi:hypothetical protein
MRSSIFVPAISHAVKPFACLRTVVGVERPWHDLIRSKILPELSVGAMVKASNAAAAGDEQRKMRRLRLLVDITTAAVRGYPLSRADAECVVRVLRVQVLRLFPDKADTFELIYGRRFRRLIDERFGAE